MAKWLTQCDLVLQFELPNLGYGVKGSIEVRCKDRWKVMKDDEESCYNGAGEGSL